MAGILGSIKGLFKGKKQSQPPNEQENPYHGLRKNLLTSAPASIKLTPDNTNGVWAVLMEMGQPGAVITLVCVAEGTVSLYFSTGGGMLGIGEHDAPRAAAMNMIGQAPRFLAGATKTTSFPLPYEGMTRFYFLTFDGVLTVAVKTDELGNEQSPLSELFFLGQDVITQARIVEEQMKQQQGR